MKFFNCGKDNNTCPCEDYTKYELKLKCMKTTLHSRYISCIAIGIVIWTLATGKANSSEFSSWISFASTVTSIILSVIAIIMSISGENKTDAMRNQMEETAQKLETTADAIENANKKNEENIKDLKDNIEILQSKITLLQGKTEAVLNRYENNNKNNQVSVANNALVDKSRWAETKNE